MRRTMLLLVTVGLVLVLVGGVAASKQLQEQDISSQSSTTSDIESGGDVSIQSTTQKASFASGSGATFLRVAVSNHGNLLAFESPQGQSQTGNGEGYAVCSVSDFGVPNGGYTVNGWDSGSEEAGWGTTTISQPNPGKFPLAVTRNTSDGKFRLKQVWAKPDAIEKDVTVTMTLKNISSATINNVALVRNGDFDVGGSLSDQAASTDDSAWQWDDQIEGPDQPTNTGFQLSALTFATPHVPGTMSFTNWGISGKQNCNPANTSGGAQDWAMQIYYRLGNLSAGASKTVKFEYEHM